MKTRNQLPLRAKLTLAAAIALAASSSAQAQTTIPTGDTTYTGPLSLGAITRTAGNTATFRIDTGTISGSAGTGAAVLNSILPWGTVSNTGTSAAGTNAGFTFGTYSGGNIVAYTGATQFSSLYWTAPGSNTTNYDITATSGNMGAARTANSIRYVGAADGTSNLQVTLTLNALMNASTKKLDLLFAGGTLAIGTNNEFVVSAAAGQITIGTPITGASASLTKTGANTLILSGANTYGSTTGKTNINAGTLLATNAAALPGYNAASKVSVASGATLAVRAGAASGEWSSAQIDSVLGATTAAFASGSNLGIDVTTGNSFSYANNIGANQTAKGLVKSGDGTLTLSGTNTYTGKTTVAAGVLALGASGSIASNIIEVQSTGTFNVAAVSGYSLSSTRTLQGTGRVIGAVSMAGTLAIGDSSPGPGTMRFDNNLTLAAGSTANFDINGFGAGQYDLALNDVVGTQSAIFNGGTLNLNFLSGFNTTGSVKIFDFDAYSGLGFTTVNTSGLASGYSATFDITNGLVTVVPEPTATALGLLAAGGLLLRRRR